MNSKEYQPKIPNTLEEFSALLQTHGVPIDQWGIGKAKTIGHLFKEVEAGDSHLIISGGELVRRVKVALLRVYFTDDSGSQYLREDRQKFFDGRVRVRDWLEWSIAEKILPGESTTKAAKRAPLEELGIEGDVDMDFLETNQEQRLSISYPGLNTEYEMNYFEAHLTEDQYDPNGYVEEQSDKKTYWVWQPAQ